MDLFEKAAIGKYRFSSLKGELTVEDLYDLKLKDENPRVATLDNVARAISKKIKDAGEESFVDEKSSANTILQNQLDIVKHIIATKKADDAAKKDLRAKNARKNELLELMKMKKMEADSQKDYESLAKEYNDLLLETE